MKDKERKEEYLKIFKAGRESNLLLSTKEAFDIFLESFDYDLFMLEHYNPNHQHRETCKIKYPYYFPVGDTEHGCNCTGKLNRYLTTKEIYDLVISIPDDEIALNKKYIVIGETKNGSHEYKTEKAFHIMQHIADFRGETYSNCKENYFTKGCFLERVMHFPGIGTYPCGATFKFVEEGNDPKFQQSTQKERVLALLKAMMKYEM